jgi:hypothetical protein
LFELDMTGTHHEVNGVEVDATGKAPREVGARIDRGVPLSAVGALEPEKAFTVF